jgi:hypothetical protein
MTYILTPPKAKYASQVWPFVTFKGEVDLPKNETFV